MIAAKIIADSLSPSGHRLTTMQVTMHRFVLAEFNTHRKFSRNSASSRAIPIDKRIKEVVENPAMPLEWGSNKPGMQAGAELDESGVSMAKYHWLNARDAAVDAADRLSRLGLHKQVANRLLEPFLWHTAVVTSTEWENFFRQRCSPLAQPEIRVLAERMREALAGSIPDVLDRWHLPYLSVDERNNDDERFMPLEVSVARCARVSYLTQEGVRDPNEDRKLFKRLKEADPPHMSPFEHVAIPVECLAHDDSDKLCGNFDGWAQMRQVVFQGGVARS